jgi:EpsI family protein
MPSRQLLRACVFALFMAGVVVVAWVWRPTHFIADSNPKVDLEALFPKIIGEWMVDPSIVPLQPAPDLQKVIAETYDQTLARTYRNASGDRVMLSVAYGRNQHEGMNTHRPEICYPGQGFPIVPGSPTVSTLAFRGQPLKVTKLVASTRSRNEPITYWLIVGDEVTTYGRGHKLVTLEYGLRGKIPDGLLIRISSIDPDATHAFALQARFIDQMLGAMTPAARVAVLGRSVPPV